MIGVNVVNDLVGYNGLKIVQNSDYFNFSLESILLPRFCILNKKEYKIMDLCTGNAPIPLILSTMTTSKIIGVELQKEIYELAKESVRINNLDDRIDIINLDIKDLFNKYNTDSFDLITCNPPYFKYSESSNINDNQIKSIARHEIKINLEDILVISKKLLKNGSSLVMVHTISRMIEVLTMMKKNNLEVKRIQVIYPKANEEANLFLVEARKNGSTGVKVLPPLICHNEDGSYTEEVLKIFER